MCTRLVARSDREGIWFKHGVTLLHWVILSHWTLRSNRFQCPIKIICPHKNRNKIKKNYSIKIELPTLVFHFVKSNLIELCSTKQHLTAIGPLYFYILFISLILSQWKELIDLPPFSWDDISILPGSILRGPFLVLYCLVYLLKSLLCTLTPIIHNMNWNK